MLPVAFFSPFLPEQLSVSEMWLANFSEETECVNCPISRLANRTPGQVSAFILPHSIWQYDSEIPTVITTGGIVLGD